MEWLIVSEKEIAGYMTAAYFTQKPQYNTFCTLRDLKDKKRSYRAVTDLKKVEEIIELIKHEMTINNDWMRDQ